MTFTDSRAFDDPLVICFDHLFKICIGKKARRDISTKGTNFHTQGLAQSAVLQNQGLIRKLLFCGSATGCVQSNRYENRFLGACEPRPEEKARHRELTAHARARYR